MNRESPRFQDSLSDSESPEASDVPEVISFEELAGDRNEITIEYEGQHYRLRVTKNGRLSLNK